MKQLFFILVILFPLLVFCQQMPAQMSVNTIKTGEHSYALRIEVLIGEGWHLFASADAATGIEPLTISLGNENIPILNDPIHQVDFRSVMIHEALFNNRLFSAYTGKIIIEKSIETDAHADAFTVILKGLACNGQKLLPIEIIKDVNLNGNVGKERN